MFTQRWASEAGNITVNFSKAKPAWQIIGDGKWNKVTQMLKIAMQYPAGRQTVGDHDILHWMEQIIFLKTKTMNKLNKAKGVLSSINTSLLLSDLCI